MKVDPYRFWNRFDEIRDGEDIQSLAKRADLKYKTLLAMRTNQSIPKSAELYQMANALDVSMEYLLVGKEYNSRVWLIARACEKASDLELEMVERILGISSKKGEDAGNRAQ